MDGIFLRVIIMMTKLLSLQRHQTDYKMKLNKIKPNPDNPRVLRDEKFEKLKKSLIEFPEMMEKRPIVIDENGVILGGNMRYRVLQDIYGKKGEIPDSWVIKAEGWTEEQKKQFIIKDNAAFGEWDWDRLANEWNAPDLADWGVDFPNDWANGGDDMNFDEFFKEGENAKKKSDSDEIELTISIPKAFEDKLEDIKKALQLTCQEWEGVKVL